MSQPRIAEMERGDGNPKLETLIRLANAFDVSLSTLVAVEPTAPERAADSLDWPVFAQPHVRHNDVLVEHTPRRSPK
jgi:transcriptional regulator with XRE-family HTH domain